MPSFTKKAIQQSFLKLLNEKPMKQITVKDIVEDCGINRNSFYYHFADIPSLAEGIVMEDAERLIREHPTIDSLEEGIGAALQFAQENRRAVLHIYHSVSRDVFETYLMRICEYVVTTYIRTAFPNAKLSEKDNRALIRFYKCECFGQIIQWMNDGMKDDLQEDFHRIWELREGLVRKWIQE